MEREESWQEAEADGLQGPLVMVLEWEDEAADEGPTAVSGQKVEGGSADNMSKVRQVATIPIDVIEISHHKYRQFIAVRCFNYMSWQGIQKGSCFAGSEES